MSPERSTAVSPDNVIFSCVTMSWTVAPEPGPRTVRTSWATAGGDPVVFTSTVWGAFDPVRFPTYDAFATMNESWGAVGNSRTIPT